MALLASHTNLRWSKTLEPCPVDGILTDRHDQIRYVVEQKSRQMTETELRTRFANEWLMTASKLPHLQAAARCLHVPAVGVLYLVPEPLVLVVRLADATGALVASIRYERTVTQATINGGQALRDNAYIGMAEAVRYAPWPELTAEDLRW